MKKRILIGLIVVLLVSLFIFLVSFYTKPTVQPTSPPDPTQPTPTSIPPTTSPVQTKTVPEVVSEALKGKYKGGDVIRVTGTKTSLHAGVSQTYLFLGPAEENIYVALWLETIENDSDDNKYWEFRSLRNGTQITVEAKYFDLELNHKEVGVYKGVVLMNPSLLPSSQK